MQEGLNHRQAKEIDFPHKTLLLTNILTSKVNYKKGSVGAIMQYDMVKNHFLLRQKDGPAAHLYGITEMYFI